MNAIEPNCYNLWRYWTELLLANCYHLHCFSFLVLLKDCYYSTLLPLLRKNFSLTNHHRLVVLNLVPQKIWYGPGKLMGLVLIWAW